MAAGAFVVLITFLITDDMLILSRRPSRRRLYHNSSHSSDQSTPGTKVFASGTAPGGFAAHDGNCSSRATPGHVEEAAVLAHASSARSRSRRGGSVLTRGPLRASGRLVVRFVPGGVRQLAGAACGAARPQWRGLLGASSPAEVHAARPGPLQSGASGCCAPALRWCSPGQADPHSPGNALASLSWLPKGWGGSFRGTKPRGSVWSAASPHPMLPFSARSPQDLSDP